MISNNLIYLKIRLTEAELVAKPLIISTLDIVVGINRMVFSHKICHKVKVGRFNLYSICPKI